MLTAGLSNSTHALLDSVLMDFVPRVCSSFELPSVLRLQASAKSHFAIVAEPTHVPCRVIVMWAGSVHS